MKRIVRILSYIKRARADDVPLPEIAFAVWIEIGAAIFLRGGRP